MDQPPRTVFDDLRPPVDDTVIYRAAGVLILLYPRAGQDYVVFTRRTERVEHHKGQISLPGGAQDPIDPDIVHTALREANEELGIDPAAVQVLTTLPEVYARVSSFVITPVVARLRPEVLESDLIFQPNPDEVAETIEVPLSALRDEAHHRIETRSREGFTFNIHFYTYGPYEIWGATGRIIYEFLSTLE